MAQSVKDGVEKNIMSPNKPQMHQDGLKGGRAVAGRGRAVAGRGRAWPGVAGRGRAWPQTAWSAYIYHVTLALPLTICLPSPAPQRNAPHRWPPGGWGAALRGRNFHQSSV